MSIKKEVDVKEYWKLIGKVGVDSGQLMVCDPGYIKEQWKDTDLHLDDMLRVVATGKLIPSPRKIMFETGDMTKNFESDYKDGLTYNGAIAAGILEHVSEKETNEFSYDGCCKATIKKGYGQLNYTLGHAGVGVVFSSGWGDGLYEVWAKFKDFGCRGFGGIRITEVKIVMIEDDGETIEEVLGKLLGEKDE